MKQISVSDLRKMLGGEFELSEPLAITKYGHIVAKLVPPAWGYDEQGGQSRAQAIESSWDRVSRVKEAQEAQKARDILLNRMKTRR
jgi:hypothetical protein